MKLEPKWVIFSKIGGQKKAKWNGFDIEHDTSEITYSVSSQGYDNITFETASLLGESAYHAANSKQREVPVIYYWNGEQLYYLKVLYKNKRTGFIFHDYEYWYEYKWSDVV